MGKLSTMQEKMVNGMLEKFKASEQFRDLERQFVKEAERIAKLERLRDMVFNFYYRQEISFDKNVLMNIIKQCDLVDEFNEYFINYPPISEGSGSET